MHADWTPAGWVLAELEPETVGLPQGAWSRTIGPRQSAARDAFCSCAGPPAIHQPHWRLVSKFPPTCT